MGLVLGHLRFTFTEPRDELVADEAWNRAVNLAVDCLTEQSLGPSLEWKDDTTLEIVFGPFSDLMEDPLGHDYMLPLLRWKGVRYDARVQDVGL